MNLVDMIGSVKKQVEAQMPVLREEVDVIIRDRVVSIGRIERLLDTLLDCSMMGCGDEEFKRLNSYYATVHSENSEIYDVYFAEAD